MFLKTKRIDCLPLDDAHEERVDVPVGLLHHGVHLVPTNGEDLDQDAWHQNQAQVDAAVPVVALVEVGGGHDDVCKIVKVT